MGYDGYITIGTKLDTSGIDANMSRLGKSLESKTTQMSNTMSKTFSLLKTTIVGLGIGAIIYGITKELDSAISRVDTLNNFANVMGNMGIQGEQANKAINYLSDKLMGLPTKLDDAAQSVQRFTSVNGNLGASTEMFLAVNNAILAGGASAQQQASAMYQLIDAYSRGKPDMMDWRSIMAAMPAQMNQVAQVMGYGANGAHALGEALRNGDVSMNEFLVTMTKMNKEGLNGFKSLEEQARGATGGIQTSIINMKTAISRGLANIINEIGQTNIASFFQGIAKAITTATNYIAAFVRVVMTAIKAVAALFGKKTAKSTTDTGKATTGASNAMGSLGDGASDTSKKLNNTAKAAKKLNKALKQTAAFDEMNVLHENKGSSGTGGNKNDGGAGSYDLSAIDIGMDDIGKKASKVDEIYNNMMDTIKTLGENLKRIDFSSIMTHISNIGKSLKEIFTDPQVVGAALNWSDTFINMLSSMVTNIIKIGANIIESFVGSIDLYLQQNKDRIKTKIADIFNIQADLNDLTNDIFEILGQLSEVFTSGPVKQIGADLINIFVDPIITIIQLFGRLGRDILDLFVTPIKDNLGLLKTTWEDWFAAIQPMFDTFSKAVSYIGDSIIKLYDKHLKPLFDSVKKGLSDSFGKFLEAFNNYIKPFVEKVAKDFQKLWREHLKPLWDNVAAFIGSVIDLIKVVWEKWTKPLIDWLIKTIIPIVVPILEQIWIVVKTVFKLIADILSGFFKQLKNIISFIKNVFKGDWKAAWENIKNFFKTPFETVKKIAKDVMNGVKERIDSALQAIKRNIGDPLKKIKNKFIDTFSTIKTKITNIINGIIGAFEGMVNGGIRAVNKLLKPIANLSSKVLKVMGLSGFSFSGIPLVSIPRLAQGGIVNMPGRGVPVGGAITGERGAEGVIPLTDSQQMALLGEAIGKYITINANITNTMNGRVISRELQRVQNDSDFAFNR